MSRTLSLLAFSLIPTMVIAAEPPASGSDTAVIQSDANQESDQPTAGTAAPTPRESRLAAYLSGAQFVGKFTVDGKEDKLPKTERYTISKCEKLPATDMYRLTARITYGKVDSEVPMDIKILWSGNTPVITLDQLWIPGMGTFDARVMIHSDRYAGTWQHDEVGGHMFGQIQQAAKTDAAGEPAANQ
ncbi:hypothetical protein K227x_49100 [Rubripirellula lacrimiformis]|uniref:Uncharacterized protein n=1 Tax=Rubripirellula lacrimiformis TaxID=1930273 RepID=A0A517NH79_9BACT|nr:hypothetical protein [Rubripirellula lacrimiformis]QDT06500.1 hypothetical protein K227x_49100 [Rubripirellula lacrimiformis]